MCMIIAEETVYIHFAISKKHKKTVEGDLTADMKDAADVKKMMLLKALEKVQLPLSFKTTIGYGTGHERVYNISPSQLGYLYAYTPAVNEKGKK